MPEDKLLEQIILTINTADVIGCGCCAGGPSWERRTELRPKAEALGTDVDTLFLAEEILKTVKECK